MTFLISKDKYIYIKKKKERKKEKKKKRNNNKYCLKNIKLRFI